VSGYQPVARPTPIVGAGCRIQGRAGVHRIEEIRSRMGRIGLRIGCSVRWYSELSARMVDDPIDCGGCREEEVPC